MGGAVHGGARSTSTPNRGGGASTSTAARGGPSTISTLRAGGARRCTGRRVGTGVAAGLAGAAPSGGASSSTPRGTTVTLSSSAKFSGRRSIRTAGHIGDASFTGAAAGARRISIPEGLVATGGRSETATLLLRMNFTAAYSFHCSFAIQSNPHARCPRAHSPANPPPLLNGVCTVCSSTHIGISVAGTSTPSRTIAAASGCPRASGARRTSTRRGGGGPSYPGASAGTSVTRRPASQEGGGGASMGTQSRTGAVQCSSAARAGGVVTTSTVSGGGSASSTGAGAGTRGANTPGGLANTGGKREEALIPFRSMPTFFAPQTWPAPLRIVSTTLLNALALFVAAMRMLRRLMRIPAAGSSTPSRTIAAASGCPRASGARRTSTR